MDGPLRVLALDAIVEINRRMILHFGGVFFAGDNNLLNRGSLEHVLEAIQGPIFGNDLYPTIFEKAAAISWQIITRHVFHDGNKRTGTEAARLFLDVNGYSLQIDQEVINIALQVARNEVQFVDFTRWIISKTTLKKPLDTLTSQSA